MKILIAVPTFETIYPDVFKAIYDLKRIIDVEYVFEFIRGYDCAIARNKIVMKAQELKADYILMVDNDVIIPSDTIEKFLHNPIDVCLGVYPKRNSDNTYDGKICMFKYLDDHGNELFDYKTEDLFTVKELRMYDYRTRIHGGGMGCAFIKTSVFDRIEYPWFYYQQYPNKEYLSEDLFLCEQLKRNKIPIYMDTRVRCKHILRNPQECI